MSFVYLKIDMSALGLFFLPRHVNEWPLDVIVNDFGTAARPLAHFLLVRRIAFDSQPDLLKASLLQNLFGHVTVLDVLEEPIHGRAEDS